MHRYFLKMPGWVKRLYPRYTWMGPPEGGAVYLTFDDGPHPEITPWVLDRLAQYGAKATFFCIGKNVALYPEVFQRILDEGHSVGNHTENHLNGWKTEPGTYLENVRLAAARIPGNLFRPPYGRIRKAQALGLPAAMGVAGPKVVLWDVLSADFDRTRTPQQCLETVLKHTVPGSIIVFHDSEKARPNLEGSLPQVLRLFSEKGFLLKALERL